MLTTEYYNYCLKNELYIQVDELCSTKNYYWHSYFSNDVYNLTFERKSGNTYIFKSDSILALSPRFNFIMGLSENFKINTFNFKYYIE